MKREREMSGFTSASLPEVATSGRLYFHTNIRLPSRLLPTVVAALLCYTGSLPIVAAAVFGNGRSPSFIDSINHTVGQRFTGVDVSDEDREQPRSPNVVAHKAPRVRQSSPPRTPWIVAQTTRGGTFRRQRHAAALAANTESTKDENKGPSSLPATVDEGMETHEDIIETGESVAAEIGMKLVDQREGVGEAEESDPRMGRVSELTYGWLQVVCQVSVNGLWNARGDPHSITSLHASSRSQMVLQTTYFCTTCYMTLLTIPVVYSISYYKSASFSIASPTRPVDSTAVPLNVTRTSTLMTM